MPRLRVLLIEDNETNRFVAHEVLLAADCYVVTAQDGQQGVDYAIAQAFDLILLDINLPTLNGWEAANEILRSNTAKSRLTPIYALTGSILPDQHEKAVKAGMRGIILKPLRAKLLEQIFAKLNKTSHSDTSSEVRNSSSKNLESSVIDHDVVAELRVVLGPVLLKIQQQKFVNEISSGLEHLLASSRASGFQETSQLAHQLAGSALVFGAKTIALKLSEIEVSLATPLQEKIEQLLAEISLLILMYAKKI